MKIGIYSPYLDTLTGGELYIFTIAEVLSKNHDVFLFWDKKEIVDKAEKRFNLDLSKVNILENIFSRRYGFFDRIKSSSSFDRIIYLSDGSLPFVGLNKLIVHFQFPILKKNVSLSERKKILFVKSVICNSEFTKKYIDKAYGVKSQILYPPAQKIGPSRDAKENIILTVGRYQPYGDGSDYKKLSFMIEAFKKIHKKNPKWKMLIITSVKDADGKAFKKEIENKVDKSIEIVKNAGFDIIQNAYKKSKIYWHASGFGEDLGTHPERAEHFGMSTVEAMSAGCIPVVINAGGQSEIVSDGESGFLWDKEDELLNLTQQMIDSKDFKVLSERVRKASERFGKDRFADELDKLIR